LGEGVPGSKRGNKSPIGHHRAVKKKKQQHIHMTISPFRKRWLVRPQGEPKLIKTPIGYWKKNVSVQKGTGPHTGIANYQPKQKNKTPKTQRLLF